MIAAQQINGLHAPNVPLSEWTRALDAPRPRFVTTFWERVRNATQGAGWLKLLAPEHTPEDAAWARFLGLRVIVRAPGEGRVHWETVAELVEQFAGLAAVIECGNEPGPAVADWWDHCWYMQQIAQHVLPLARARGIALCTPGWQGQAEPLAVPAAGPVAELRALYAQFDAIGVHVYDPFTLARPAVYERVDRWAATWQKPVHITEYGIAARLLDAGSDDEAASNLIKAGRYATFVRALVPRPHVLSACAFILGGTRDFASFNAGGYEPGGDNSYWLDGPAWLQLGRLIAGA